MKERLGHSIGEGPLPSKEHLLAGLAPQLARLFDDRLVKYILVLQRLRLLEIIYIQGFIIFPLIRRLHRPLPRRAVPQLLLRETGLQYVYGGMRLRRRPGQGPRRGGDGCERGVDGMLV